MPALAALPLEPDRAEDRLAAALPIPRILAALLVRRGIDTPDAARAFLDPDASRLADHSLLKGASEAADVLVSAARRGKRIVVFGDCDVDGITAVAQLRACLR